MPGVNRHRTLAETPWQKLKEAPAIGVGEVHLWRLDTNDFQAMNEALTACLSQEEIDRSSRFHFSHDRRCYLIVRSELRRLLSAYLGCTASSLQIAITEKGKPYLSNHPSLKFNLSHSGSHAVIAIRANREVGVDLEVIDRSFRVENILQRYFSPREIPVLMAMPPQARQEAFFLAWTRKEAIIKAHGDGLSLPLDQFGVSIAREAPVELLHLDWEPEAVREWRLYSFTAAHDVPAAVAFMGGSHALSFYDLPIHTGIA